MFFTVVRKYPGIEESFTKLGQKIYIRGIHPVVKKCRIRNQGDKGGLILPKRGWGWGNLLDCKVNFFRKNIPT